MRLRAFWIIKRYDRPFLLWSKRCNYDHSIPFEKNTILNGKQGWIQTSATSFQKLVRIVKNLKKKTENHARKSQPQDAN